MKYIPKEQCKNRKLYFIDSRNLSFAVYREESGGFIGIRHKFGDDFLFEEYHWDNGSPFGTVKPIKELPEDLPSEIKNETSIGTVCSECNLQVEYINFPEGERELTLKNGRTYTSKGQWTHKESTQCDNVSPLSRENEPLFNWLIKMAEKYKNQEDEE